MLKYIVTGVALLSLLVFLSYALTKGFDPRKQQEASQKWAMGALNAALCEKPPCQPEAIAKIMGPMRTEQEWRKLAESGDEAAQSQQCSAHGFKNDVGQDYYLKIVTWCRKEAEKGSLSAEYLMAKLYASGQIAVTQSWEETYFWYAVRIGKSNSSLIERDEAAKHLTAQQVKQIDDRVIKWKEQLCASNPTERNAKVMRDWHCEEVK